MSRIDHDVFAEITKEASKLANHESRLRGLPPGMDCMYVTHFMCEFLNDRDMATLPVGGTAHIPIMLEEDDDGVTPTHISWVFDNTLDPIAHQFQIEMGRLPEMHCWLYLPQFDLIVDASQRSMPDAVRLAGLEWKLGTPEDCLVYDPSGVSPDKSTRTPCRAATGVLWTCLRRQFDPSYLMDGSPARVVLSNHRLYKGD